MTWRVEWAKEAVKDTRRLDRPTRKRIPLIPNHRVFKYKRKEEGGLVFLDFSSALVGYILVRGISHNTARVIKVPGLSGTHQMGKNGPPKAARQLLTPF